MEGKIKKNSLKGSLLETSTLVSYYIPVSIVKANIRQIKRISHTNPCGGILFCLKRIRSTGIPAVLDKALGIRAKQAKYKHSDVVLSWILSILCGSKRLEDTKHLKQYFIEIPEVLHPSPDTIGRVFKSFASEIIHYQAKEADHEVCMNTPLNQLLLDVALKLKQVNPNSNNVIDYDNVIIPCEKYDAKFSYKHTNGYCPGIAFINKTPVYVENRNGNSLAKYKIDETLERIFDLLELNKIKIARFRSDAAAYTKQTVRLLDQRGIEFFIRANRSGGIFDKALENSKWEQAFIGDMPVLVTSINYHFADKEYRVVVTKMRDSRQMSENKYSKDKDTLRAIITNCRSMTNADVIAFYNKRGAAELNFTDLLNDWNFKRLSHSFMNENLVFMVFGAIGKVIYNHLLEHFSKKVDFVKRTHRLKEFIFNFISIHLEWRIENNEPIAYLHYFDRDYSPLLGRPPSST